MANEGDAVTWLDVVVDIAQILGVALVVWVVHWHGCEIDSLSNRVSKLEKKP